MKYQPLFLLLLFLTSCGAYYTPVQIMHNKYLAVYPARSVGITDSLYHIACFFKETDIPAGAKNVKFLVLRRGYYRWNRVVKHCIKNHANAVLLLSENSTYPNAIGFRNSNVYGAPYHYYGNLTSFLLMQVPDSSINRPIINRKL